MSEQVGDSPERRPDPPPLPLERRLDDAAPADAAGLRRAVAVMDRLRSPGGCPWDAAQTHRSLARYLLEETYELLEAIETDDVVLLREELGDVLLQVLFHARLAAERPDGQSFDIDDVAGDLADKLERRHPHVFGATAPDRVGVADLDAQWEERKFVEKGRTSVVDGIPINQPALALAAKLVNRARRAGLNAELDPAPVAEPSGTGEIVGSAGPARVTDQAASEEIGARLLRVVTEAVARGVDPESALRAITRRLADSLRTAEDRRGSSPGRMTTPDR